MDPPDMLVEGALQNHYKMIKQMKGAWDIKITTYLNIEIMCYNRTLIKMGLSF